MHPRTIHPTLLKTAFVTGLTLLLPMAEQALAQRVANDYSPLREYDVALEHFQKQKYAVAQHRFEQATLRADELPSIFFENTKFYGALSGLELFNPDGELMMEAFAKAHPEHPKAVDAHFHLGRSHFSKKRFKAVTDEFAKVDPHELDESYLEEYYFKKGYAHFQQEQFPAAQDALAHVVKGGKKYRSPAIYYNSYILYKENKNEVALKGFRELEGDALFGNTVPFYILQILYRQKQHDEVIAYGEALLKKDIAKGRTGEVHRILGESNYVLERYAKAVPHLENAVTELGGNRDDRYKLGYASYRAGDCEKSVTYLSEVVREQDPMAQLAYYHMGDCHLKSGQKMQARNAFRSASRLSFDEKLKEDALFNFAKLAYELSFDPYNEAVQAFSEYIAAHPESERIDESYGFLLKIYLVTRNYEAALDAMDRIRNKDNELKATYQRVAYIRGTELFNDLQFNRAAQYFQLSEKYPIDLRMNAQVKFWKAEANARLKKPKTAEELYLSFIESPGAISLLEYGMAHYAMGYLYFERELYTESASWFRRFNELRGQDDARVSDAHARTGDCYYLQRNPGLAIDFYDKALRMKQADADYAMFQIAVCYGIQGKSASKIESLKSMLESYPNTAFAADAKYEVAETQFFLDNTAEALKWFDRVIAEHPNSNYMRRAKLHKGLIYYNKSEDERALPLFKDVAENHPATPEAKEALMKIQKIYIENTDVDGFERYMASQKFPDITKGALDTSYYQAAELRYVRGDLAGALKDLGGYLERFPNGFFALNAHFYRAEVANQLKMYDDSQRDYGHVLGFAKNSFTERSLVAVGRIFMAKQDYQQAVTRFALLEELAELAENLLESRVGLMRGYFALGKFTDAEAYAEKVMRADRAPKELVSEAHLISAKCALEQGNLPLAEARFQETLLKSNSEVGAEAMYHLAKIRFLQGNYAETERMVFEMVNIFPNYKVWIANAFILLADTYEKQGDLFQAKLTLQNVVDNYLGVLKEDAQRKLDALNAAQPALKDRQDGSSFQVEFEQERKSDQQIFEGTEVEE
jgi:tetratricopeptide (TPR) repeat protein